jgi:putative transcriptional regulator
MHPSGMHGYFCRTAPQGAVALRHCEPLRTGPDHRRIIQEMQETFADLKKSGVISKKQMAEFDALKNLEVKAFQPKVIKQLRTKEHLSQAVFAAVLNISTSTIQKWETGEKKPSGPSLKLLSILKNKGIEALI